MRVFIINLRQHTKRNSHMKSLCNAIGLDYKFIDAVYGRELVNIGQYKKDSSQSVQQLGRELSNGEIGCILSHQSIYREMIKKSMPYALILEDDVDLNADVVELCKKVELESLECDTLLLGYHGKTREQLLLNASYMKTLNKSTKVYKLNELAYGAYGYIISLQGAVKLLEQSSTFILPIDHYTGNPFVNNVLCLYPQMVTINKNLSDNSVLMQERAQFEFKKFEEPFRILSEKITNNKKKIAICGFNTLGLLLYRHYKTDVCAIIDKNKNMQQVDDLIVSTIEASKLSDCLFVVTAMNIIYIQEIVQSIRSYYPLNEIVSLLEK